MNTSIIKQIVIPGTDILVSRFIFGTASWRGIGTRKSRVQLLDAAVDCGFTHFDAAPYYGSGMSERSLAPVLARNPNTSVTTKVGIYPAGGANQTLATALVRRAAAKMVPSLRLPTVNFDLTRAKKSLEGSLRRLRRDHVELLMLHEPLLAMVKTDEWLRWLEHCVTSGWVGHFGIASPADKLEPFLREAPELVGVVQTLDSLDHKEADILARYGRPMQITYGYLSSARSRNDSSPAADILAHALKRNTNGAIIVTTTKLDRLAQYTKLSESMP